MAVGEASILVLIIVGFVFGKCLLACIYTPPVNYMWKE